MAPDLTKDPCVMKEEGQQLLNPPGKMLTYSGSLEYQGPEVMPADNICHAPELMPFALPDKPLKAHKQKGILLLRGSSDSSVIIIPALILHPASA